MTTTLDPRTPTAERFVVRRPNRITGGVIVAAVAVLVALPFVASDTVVDESHQFAETQRMQSLAPAPAIDTSSETAELRRFQTLAPEADESHQVAETQRMRALAPAIDTSWETAEYQRMLALQP